MKVSSFARLMMAVIPGLLAASALAGGFRCGTDLVIPGDSVARLIGSCGQPVMKYKAKESVREDGSRKMTGVTNWVYERGRRKNMVVSVRSGKVVRIAVE